MANMVGERAVKCLISRDWFVLALFVVSVSEYVPVSGISDGVEEKLISIPIASPNPDNVHISHLSLDANAGKELAKNNTYAFEYSKGFRMPGNNRCTNISAIIDLMEWLEIELKKY